MSKKKKSRKHKKRKPVNMGYSALAPDPLPELDRSAEALTRLRGHNCQLAILAIERTKDIKEWIADIPLSLLKFHAAHEITDECMEAACDICMDIDVTTLCILHDCVTNPTAKDWLPMIRYILIWIAAKALEKEGYIEIAEKFDLVSFPFFNGGKKNFNEIPNYPAFTFFCNQFVKAAKMIKNNPEHTKTMAKDIEPLMRALEERINTT